MKIQFVFAAFLFVLAACSTPEKTAETETETTTEESKDVSYGPEKVDAAKAVPVSKMLEMHEGKDSKEEYTFEGTIVDVCSKAGCWVNIDKGDGETFMVRFKDHFTIPTDTKAGTKVLVHGLAWNDEVSVDMLRHFAEDAGQSQEEIEKITEPSFELNFEADGITLVK